MSMQRYATDSLACLGKPLRDCVLDEYYPSIAYGSLQIKLSALNGTKCSTIQIFPAFPWLINTTQSQRNN